MIKPLSICSHIAGFAVILMLTGCGEPTWVDAPPTCQAVQEECRSNPEPGPAAAFDQPPFVTLPVTLSNQVEVFSHKEGIRRYICPGPGWKIATVNLKKLKSGSHILTWAGGQPAFVLDEMDLKFQDLMLVPPGTDTISALALTINFNERNAPETMQSMSRLSGLPPSFDQAMLLARLISSENESVESPVISWLEHYTQDAFLLPRITPELITIPKVEWVRYAVTCQKPSEWLWQHQLGKMVAAERLFSLSGYTISQPLAAAYRAQPSDYLYFSGGLTPAQIGTFSDAAKTLVSELLTSKPEGMIKGAVAKLRRTSEPAGMAFLAWAASRPQAPVHLIARQLFSEFNTPLRENRFSVPSKKQLMAGYTAVDTDYRLALAEAFLKTINIDSQYRQPVITEAELYRLVVDNDLPTWVAGREHRTMPAVLTRALLRTGDEPGIAKAAALGFNLPHGLETVTNCIESHNDALTARLLADTSSIDPAQLIPLTNIAADNGMILTVLQLERIAPTKISAKKFRTDLLMSGRRDAARQVFARWPFTPDSHEAFLRLGEGSLWWNHNFADEPGWGEELLAHGLTAGTPEAERLVYYALNFYPNLLRSLAHGGIPFGNPGRYFHPLNYEESEGQLYRRIEALLASSIAADQPPREDIEFNHPAPEWARMVTPLGSAIRSNFPRVARLLIAHGADPRQPVCGTKNALEALDLLYPKPEEAQELRAVLKGP